MPVERKLRFAHSALALFGGIVCGGCDDVSWLLVDKQDPAAIRAYIAAHPTAHDAEALAALALAEFSLSPTSASALDTLVNEAIMGREPGQAFRDAERFLTSVAHHPLACEASKVPIRVNLTDEFDAVDVEEGLNLDYWLDLAGFARTTQDSPNQLTVRIAGRAVGTTYNEVGTLYQDATVQGELIWDTPDRPGVSGRDDLMSGGTAPWLISVGGLSGLSEQELAARRAPSTLQLQTGLANAFYTAKVCARVLSSCPSATAFKACGAEMAAADSPLARLRWSGVDDPTVYAIATDGFGDYDAKRASVGALSVIDSAAAMKSLIALSPWEPEARAGLVGRDSPELVRFLARQLPESSGAYLHQSLLAVPHLSARATLRGVTGQACADVTSPELVAACNAAIAAFDIAPTTAVTTTLALAGRSISLGPRWTRVSPPEENELEVQYTSSLRAQLNVIGGPEADWSIDDFAVFEFSDCDCVAVFLAATAVLEVDQSKLIENARRSAWDGIADRRFEKLVELRPTAGDELSGVVTELEDLSRNRSVGILLMADRAASNFVQITLLQRAREYDGGYERALRELRSAVEVGLGAR